MARNEKKKDITINADELEEMRLAKGCPTTEELFVKLGMVFHIKRSRAMGDFSRYKNARNRGLLDSFEFPTYIVAGVKAHRGPEKKSPKTSRDVAPHVRGRHEGGGIHAGA